MIVGPVFVMIHIFELEMYIFCRYNLSLFINNNTFVTHTGVWYESSYNMPNSFLDISHF